MSAVQWMDKCVSFNGVQNKCCLAGVDYRSVREPEPAGNAFRALPCFTMLGSNPATTVCAKRVLMTVEQHEASEREINAAMDAYARDLAAGLCPTCKAIISERQQVRGCIYARPCGHRIGQGKLTKGDRR